MDDFDNEWEDHVRSQPLCRDVFQKKKKELCKNGRF